MSWNKRLLKTPIIGGITKRIVSAKASKEAHSISDHFTQFLQPYVASPLLLSAYIWRQQLWA
ncbi:MAG: hypothetical protein RPR97_19400 [Colwellia sp.]